MNPGIPYPALSARSLSVGYRLPGRTFALQHDLDIELYAGELIALIGPNGSGKSTLLRTFAGFLPPLSGEITLMGRPVNTYSRNEWARNISVVLTELPHADKLTVSDLAATGRSPYTGFSGRLTNADRRKISEALRATSISHLRNQYLSRLSDGERQRALIAKSLAQDTPVILLDEPAAFLDFPGRIRMMHLLRQLAREHSKSILITTHDIGLALQYADRLWLVSHDKPLLSGIPENLALDGSLSRYFAGQQVDFDTATGKFLHNTPAGASVALDAPEPLFFWISHALNRHQVTVTSDANVTYRIVAGYPDQPVELVKITENRSIKRWSNASEFFEHVSAELFI